MSDARWPPAPSRATRITLALLIAVGLAMTSWLRVERPFLTEGPVEYRILDDLPESPAGSDIRLVRAWHIYSRRSDFGGFSALLALPGNRFHAFSDRGTELSFALGPAGDAFRFDPMPEYPAYLPGYRDIESATRDAGTGLVWLGYENDNSIRRLSPAMEEQAAVRPPAMQGWGLNSGAEAMVRLRDGRFVVLRETMQEGLLFPGDPTAGVEPALFRFAPPDGMNPTDMVQLPDGRVLVLVRSLRVGWPPFAARLLLADPARIEPGKDWKWTQLADLNALAPSENYEAVAVTHGKGGALHIWIMSDDNAAVIQRTLLLELEWTPGAKKGAAARPGAPSG